MDLCSRDGPLRYVSQALNAAVACTYSSDLGQQPQHEPFHAVHEAQLVPSTDVLELLVLRPPVHRPFILYLNNIDEACILHPVGTLFPYCKTFPKLLTHLYNYVSPGMIEMV
jgi:hypothetical protein